MNDACLRRVRGTQPAGKQQANGSWSGIMGELSEGRANMSLYPLTLTADRAAVISYSGPFLAQGYALLVQKTNAANGGMAFLAPFEVRAQFELGCWPGPRAGSQREHGLGDACVRAV